VGDTDLYAASPSSRLTAARAASKRTVRHLQRDADGWPPLSPGAANAWLLLVTTKPPAWRDALVEWQERPLSVGWPHEGFFYPDPLGFWAEVRRWALELLRPMEPAWGHADALAVTALLHLGDDHGRLDLAVGVCRPGAVLFLDEHAWHVSGWSVDAERPFELPDPHRPGQAYHGFWGVGPSGAMVGKSPQHPAAHRLYDASDLLRYLRAGRLGVGL